MNTCLIQEESFQHHDFYRDYAILTKRLSEMPYGESTMACSARVAIHIWHLLADLACRDLQSTVGELADLFDDHWTFAISAKLGIKWRGSGSALSSGCCGDSNMLSVYSYASHVHF